MAEPLLEVRDLVKHFPLRPTLLDLARRRPPAVVRAVDGVSFTLDRGRTLGLVGESGCGKSTLGRCILRLYDADRGEIRFDGVDLTRLGDDELIPSASGSRSSSRIRIPRSIPGSAWGGRCRRCSRSTALGDGGGPAGRDRRVAELLGQVGLSPADARKYPGEFSGGQRQRIGIARALAVEPELLIADEPLSALDVSIQAQILQLLLALRASLGLTMIFISHDLRVVRYLSDEVAVMYLGKIVERAPAATLFAHPRHPYTAALLSAVPEVGRRSPGRPCSSRASRRAPSTSRPAAGSIPAAPGARRGASGRRRRSESWRPRTPSPATSPGTGARIRPGDLDR